MLKQSLQQKLLQKLSPQQIQLMKLLQVPTIALEQRIKQEIEENPALDDGSEGDYDENDNFDEQDDFDQNDEYNHDEEFDFSDYVDEDDLPAYRYQVNNSSKDDEDRQIPFVSGTTFQEMLLSQLGLRIINDREKEMATFIIGNLDDSGYLQRDLDALVDDFAFTQNIMTDVDEIEHIIHIIQELDPPGIGARTLQECLLLQIERLDIFDPQIALAKVILEKYFDEFTKKHYDKIITKAAIDELQLKLAIEQILKLNPKPGDSFSETSKTVQYIIPDFIINSEGGVLELSLNSRNAPELNISRHFVEMIETYSDSKGKVDKKQKEAMMFIRQKIDSAKWFIDAIKQRQHTLISTMEAILKYQIEYFQDGDETKLKPMILKDIAEIINMDISTVSRVVNSKYVQTHFGTFLLKSLFSESLTNDEGEEVSTREVKKILQNVISLEDKKKPITDEMLVVKLKEKGYIIARRTVAKYREQLDIPVARLRKEL